MDEFTLLQQASSEINAPSDLRLTRVPEGECGDFVGGGLPALSPISFWESSPTTLVLEFEIDGFSSFYLHGPSGLSTNTQTLIRNDFLLYPNPATTELQISWSSPARQIRVLDVRGCTHFSQSIHSQQRSLTIPVEHLASGMYLLEWTDAQGRREVQKWVKD
jgi:hypothetical protein